MGGGGQSRICSLGQGGPINGLQVSVDLKHKNVNGVTVTLTSPSGTTATVPLKAGKHETGTVDLSDFNGELPQGDWTLTVNDSSSRRDTGTLTSWSLDAKVDAPSTGADGAGDPWAAAIDA